MLAHIGFEEIISIIKSGSKVLDLGCGNGDLLNILKKQKSVWGTGIDISPDNIASCVSKGVPVVQANIDEGLKGYKKDSYDYVVLSQTLQVIRKPLNVLKEMTRVGKVGIISFPNFGYWRIRSYLFFRGKMPVSKTLPYEWYNTPNIHLATIKDVKSLCEKNGIKIKEIRLLYRKNNKLKRRKTGLFSNWLSEECVMVVERL